MEAIAGRINGKNHCRRISATAVRPHQRLSELKAPPAEDLRLAQVLSDMKKLDTESVRQILGSRFIYSEDTAHILTRGLRTGKNLLLWGPAGHAKSTMVKAVIDGLGLGDQAFVLDFGEGMDEAALWGGLDFKRLQEDHELDYHPAKSFLNYPIAVFEEIFDAPPQVLCSLKNTLTSRILSKSGKPFPMKTHVIIACTNKSPDEISSLGPSSHALIERFPLQLNVKWPDYTAKSYAQMFNILGFPDKLFNQKFAELIAKSGTAKQPISPRSAVHALESVLDSVRERQGTDVQPEDMATLSYVHGLEELGTKEKEKFQEALAASRTRGLIDNAVDQITEIEKLLQASPGQLDMSRSAEIVEGLEMTLQLLVSHVPHSTLTKEFDKLQSEICQRRNDMKARLADMVLTQQREKRQQR